jgi:hypothetical protein
LPTLFKRHPAVRDAFLFGMGQFINFTGPALISRFMQRLLLFLLLFTCLQAARGQSGVPGAVHDGAHLLQDSAALKLFVGPADVLVKLYADSVRVYSAKELSRFLSKNSSRINAHKVVMAGPKDTPFSAFFPYIKALQKRHYFPEMATMPLESEKVFKPL